MNRDQLLKKMKSINNLPTLPTIALEVNRLLQDCDTPIDQLTALIEKDQSLVVKILRLVNSSFYGFRSRVNNMRHAVTLLGFNTVRNAVVTVSIIDTLNLGKALKGFDIDGFWRHAIQVAVISRYIAAKSRLAPSEDAFTAGLVHDMGKVILASFFQEDLARIVEEMNNNPKLTFVEAEEKLDSCPHNLVGSYLAQRWLLPDALIKTIQYHHSRVDRSSQTRLISIVDVGNRLAHMMKGDPGYRLRPETLQENENDTLAIVNCLKDQNDWLPALKKEMDAASHFFIKG